MRRAAGNLPESPARGVFLFDVLLLPPGLVESVGCGARRFALILKIAKERGSENTMNTNPVKQYSAKLELPNGFTGELTAPDPNILKETIQRILNGGSRIEPVAGQTDVLAVYHTSFDGGKTPVTLISAVWVAEHLSNKALISARDEQRRLQAA